MSNEKVSFFRSKAMLLIATIVCVIASLFLGIYLMIVNEVGIFSSSLYFIKAIIVVAIYISYVKHSKNIMKGLIGALLMENLMYWCDEGYYMMNLLDKIIIPLMIFFALFIFVNHLVINSTRRSRPTLIKLNTIAIIIAFVVDAVWAIYWSVAVYNEIMMYLCVAAGIVISVCISIVIIWIENKLDDFKQKREQAGWSEETGYPEDYVRGE